MITLNFNPGDVVRVHQKIIEGDPLKDAKERTQVFEGTVLAIKGMDENKTFMVRKVIDGIAVERIWPVNSPLLTKVEVKSKPKKRPRRAKLFYLRNG
ncbi:50S ribosomal protein L19 [Candidatus Microgenomates bacterium]|nr:50S ribosomal protein L19 [Candidatus Microgenomates bacterium]